MLIVDLLIMSGHRRSGVRQASSKKATPFTPSRSRRGCALPQDAGTIAKIMIRVQVPSPPLRPFIQNYAHTQVDLLSAVLFWPIPARTFACLEFTFGVPYDIHDLSKPIPERTFATALIGAKTHRQISLELNGHVETFVILLQPSGLQQLFGVPEAEIVDTHYDAHGVIGAAMSDLRAQLGEANSFAARARIADNYLLRS